SKVNDLLIKLNEELNPSNTKSRLYNLSYRSIYGTDANPRMARTAKMNMIMHGDGHGGVHHNDGLLNINGIFENRFDVILTNPPFGARVAKDQKITEEDKYKDIEKIKYYTERYRDEYKKALKQVTDNIGKPLLNLYETGAYSSLTETLFMERCLKLLKPGGRMGIVLPEGVLNNAQAMQKVREYFEGRAKILLIVSIPQEVFVASGATVKPSLVFLKRFTEQEVADYQKIVKEVTEAKDKEFKPRYDAITQKLKDKEEAIKAETDKEKVKELKEELKELKNEIKAELKQLDEEKETAIKAEIKQRFDYQIPIAEVEKAGIDSKGAKCENHLEPLRAEYNAYRKTNNLWEEIKRQSTYEILDDTLMRMPIVGEPEMFYS
ncbi:MAG: N-6 DNA methylase, partial [Cytophagales bacterium]